jgi:type 1 glutamine amidotransferase
MPSNSMNRRQLLAAAAFAGAGAVLAPAARSLAQDQGRKKILFFTKSSGFPHSVVTRKDGQPAHAERVLTEFAGTQGYDVTCSKDGSIFTPEKLAQYDAVAFYTTEDLTKNNNGNRHPKDDQGPTMPPEGPKALLDFIASGKGFIGFHCASDTFHSPNYRGDKKINQQVNMLRDAAAKLEDVRTPYIKMIGGEFVTHQSQQPATMKVVDSSFPGLDGLKDTGFTEEWYSLANFSDDLHVLLVQDTESMKAKGEAAYKRPPYPATWCKPYGGGRVFYTSMGHREDVWTNPFFQKVTLAGLAWITGKTRFDPKPNVAQATPEVVTFPAVKVG